MQTPHRRAQMREAKRRWRGQHAGAAAKAMQRYRQAKRFGRLLEELNLGERALLPWLEQMDKARPSSWRSRARDLWSAWQLVCEQQSRVCMACQQTAALVDSCWRSDGSLAGAVCAGCAAVLSIPRSVQK